MAGLDGPIMLHAFEATNDITVNGQLLKKANTAALALLPTATGDHL